MDRPMNRDTNTPLDRSLKQDARKERALKAEIDQAARRDRRAPLRIDLPYDGGLI